MDSKTKKLALIGAAVVAVGAGVTLRDGRLCDIAPTLLDLMGLDRPGEMDGETLIC